MKVGIIGTGAVGKSMAAYFLSKKVQMTGFYSKTPKHVRDTANAYNTIAFENMSQVIQNNDFVLVAVNDDAITEVVSEMEELQGMLNEKIIVHTSGVHASNILSPLKQYGAKTLSLHPLQSFSDVESAQNRIPNTVFSIEGDVEESVVEWLDLIGIQTFEIPSAYKANYHMGASIVSNFLVTVLDFGFMQFEKLGYDKTFAKKALMPLIDGTLENIKQNGTTEALTGPISRGDVQTVKKHLEALDETYMSLYLELAHQTLEIAKRKNLAIEKYDEMLKLLEEAKNG